MLLLVSSQWECGDSELQSGRSVAGFGRMGQQSTDLESSGDKHTRPITDQEQMFESNTSLFKKTSAESNKNSGTPVFIQMKQTLPF